MRDVLRFTAGRHGSHAVVKIQGHDAAGADVEFELDPDSLLTNLRHQIEWTHQVVAIEAIFQATLRSGVDQNTAWLMVEQLLPRASAFGTAMRTGAPSSDGDTP